MSRRPSRSDLEALLKFGGFPEPLFAQNETEHRIWRRDRISRVIREDLREDLQIDHKTAERWLQILENLYVCFRVSPYGAPRVRAVKKQSKLYLWDWSSVETDGPRFENMVACQLLKYCHWVEDTQGYSMELRYLRDTDKREVDFVVLKDGKPVFAVECKSGEKAIGPALRYFAERTPIPRFYQTHLGERHYSSGKLTVVPFIRLCEELGLP